ncbi:hypothetical protein ACTXT7_016158 [Hymenolepis weldensis]
MMALYRNACLPSIDVQRLEHSHADKAFAPDECRGARSDGRPRLDKNSVLIRHPYIEQVP